MAAGRARQFGNLPVGVTRFVGRRKELAEARRLLGQARLVTLTGVGGVGKTRLAVEAASQLRRAFPDGTWMADLSAVEDPSQVPQAVVNAIGIIDQSTCPAAGKIARHLADAVALIVLDNCEHLADACAALANQLLSQTRSLRVLATSRCPLGIIGEHLLLVPPLPVPGPEVATHTVAVLSQYDAVAMLADRSAALRPGFAVTGDNAAAVVRVCAKLDGLPLAIELAASRLRSLSPEQLADRLEHRFAVLNRGSSAAQPRQQTLRAVFDWSYSLCSAEERLLWVRLSVFSGTFDLDAAEAVCEGEGLPASKILDELDRLVAQSIVLAEPRGSGMRFRLLETIRHYGRERLAEAGEEEALQLRHRDFYLDLTRRLAGQWYGPRQQEGLARLRDEHANLQAALEFSAADSAGPHAALDFTVALRSHWCADGYLVEGRRWLDRVLALPGQDTGSARVHALWVAAWGCLLQGDYLAALGRLEDCDALAASLGDQRAAAFARTLRGTAELFGGRLTEAIALFEEALAIFADIADAEGSGLAHFQLAISLAHRGDSARAQAVCRRTIQASEAHGEQLYHSYALWVLSFDTWRQHGPQAADLVLQG